jgi:hypothetical protein
MSWFFVREEVAPRSPGGGLFINTNSLGEEWWSARPEGLEGVAEDEEGR